MGQNKMKKKTKTYFFLTAALVFAMGLNSVSGQNFQKPCGIYVLGSPSVTQIRNYPFVDGFVMRIGWENIESLQGIYNFSLLDNIVHKLDSLNQGLTLDIFRMSVPNYLLTNTNVEKYYLIKTATDSVYTAVPWDSIALMRFDTLLNKVANHPIYSITTGTTVPLKNHPVLKQIDASPIGMNGIRDNAGRLIHLGSYQRNKFINSILNTARKINYYFPNQFAFNTYFGINDNITSPALGNVLLDSIMSVFNRNGNPKLGFFQENIACTAPSSLNNISNPLHYYRDSTFTMYQMLQSWRNPFLTPALTNICKTDSTGPDVAINNGLNINKCHYFEVYLADLDWVGYNTIFTLWHDSLQALCSNTLTGIAAPIAPLNNGIVVFPNPFSNTVNLQLPVSYCQLKIIDMTGTTVFQKLLSSKQETLNLNLPKGMYFFQVNDNKQFIASGKLIIQ